MPRITGDEAAQLGFTHSKRIGFQDIYNDVDVDVQILVPCFEIPAWSAVEYVNIFVPPDKPFVIPTFSAELFLGDEDSVAGFLSIETLDGFQGSATQAELGLYLGDTSTAAALALSARKNYQATPKTLIARFTAIDGGVFADMTQGEVYILARILDIAEFGK